MTEVLLDIVLYPPYCSVQCFINDNIYHTGSIARYRSTFGQGDQPMILADLFCTGSEDSILDCRRNDYGLQHCSAFEVAGVQCEGIIHRESDKKLVLMFNLL